MKLKKLFRFLLIAVFILTTFEAYSAKIDMGEVIAYPNPFNPDTQNLTIKKISGSFISVEFTVYDFNQKKVYEGTASNSDITWNGYTKTGRRARPGLYFIKIIETTGDNSIAQKIIKVLIQ
ncbi:MAG: T9SS type A sorting domain-containing protein [Spirochaetia bacterium]|nr:T9SS type A sorting domain-containing protein [Spirochaetia bacterium]